MKISTTFDFNNAPSGRVYDKDALNKAFDDYVNRHNQYPMLGEVYHDSAFDDNGHFRNDISLKDVSHKIKSITNDDGTISIEAELLDTPMGKVVQQIVNMGASLSIHPRMMGHSEDVIDEEGNVIGKETVIDKIISWDIAKD